MKKTLRGAVLIKKNNSAMSITFRASVTFVSKKELQT